MTDDLTPVLIREVDLRGDRPVDDPELRTRVADLLGVGIDDIDKLIVVRRSLDRRSRPARTRFNVQLTLIDRSRETILLSKLPARYKARRVDPDEGAAKGPSVPRGSSIIVGAGPAGLTAAWALLLAGQQVTLLERGEPVDTRLRSVGKFWARAQLNPESNACFGEGGAGAFSDGKLVSRNRSRWRTFVMQTLVDFGADPNIRVEAQAHVGSDRLRRVVKSWREEMSSRGADIRFNTKVVDLLRDGDRVTGVQLESGEEIKGDRVIWATGGHARDSLRILQRHGVRITPRPMAIGLRIEHPQEIINEALAGYRDGPACEYRLKTRSEGRGVYSFCMCPGGVVVAAASEEGGQVVNGMSCHGKKSRWANSALVVEIGTDRYPEGALGGLEFQRHLEEATFNFAGGNYAAPAQRLVDFNRGRLSEDLPRSTYRPSIVSRNLNELLPVDIANALKAALPAFERQLHGYVTREALLLGSETRTSCPLEIERSKEWCSTLINLHCIGEGAGHAGGILSAAFDACDLLEVLSFQSA